MKKTFLQIVAIIGFAVCGASYAQAQNTEVYKAEIPFDFSVGKKAYTAGEYRIEVRGSEQKYFVLRDAGGHNSYIANSTPARTTSGTAKIDFQRVSGSYFLASISASNRTSNFPKALVDGRLARNTESDKVTVVMSGEKRSQGGR